MNLRHLVRADRSLRRCAAVLSLVASMLAATGCHPPVPDSIRIEGAEGPLARGSLYQLTAVVLNSREVEIENAPVQWESSEPALATISGSGELHVMEIGVVTITATSRDARGSVELNLTALREAPVVLDPALAPETARQVTSVASVFGSVATDAAMRLPVPDEGLTPLVVARNSEGEALLAGFAPAEGVLVVGPESTARALVRILALLAFQELGDEAAFEARVGAHSTFPELVQHVRQTAAAGRSFFGSSDATRLADAIAAAAVAASVPDPKVEAQGHSASAAIATVLGPVQIADGADTQYALTNNAHVALAVTVEDPLVTTAPTPLMLGAKEFCVVFCSSVEYTRHVAGGNGAHKLGLQRNIQTERENGIKLLSHYVSMMFKVMGLRIRGEWEKALYGAVTGLLEPSMLAELLQGSGWGAAQHLLRTAATSPLLPNAFLGVLKSLSVGDYALLLIRGVAGTVVTVVDEAYTALQLTGFMVDFVRYWKVAEAMYVCQADGTLVTCGVANVVLSYGMSRTATTAEDDKCKISIAVSVTGGDTVRWTSLVFTYYRNGQPIATFPFDPRTSFLKAPGLHSGASDSSTGTAGALVLVTLSLSYQVVGTGEQGTATASSEC